MIKIHTDRINSEGQGEDGKGNKCILFFLGGGHNYEKEKTICLWDWDWCLMGVKAQLYDSYKGLW